MAFDEFLAGNDDGPPVARPDASSETAARPHRSHPARIDCVCWTPPFVYTGFESRLVGIDETAGRFAEVSVERCKRCDQAWLKYFFEFEGISRSGRWYRGAVSDEQAASVSPATALAALSRLDSYFYGGSYFDTSGARCDAPLDLARV